MTGVYYWCIFCVPILSIGQVLLVLGIFTGKNHLQIGINELLIGQSWFKENLVYKEEHQILFLK
jgi:hypothetical protein